jgi:predicted nuclease with RNAse H fold
MEQSVTVRAVQAPISTHQARRLRQIERALRTELRLAPGRLGAAIDNSIRKLVELTAIAETVRSERLRGICGTLDVEAIERRVSRARRELDAAVSARVERLASRGSDKSRIPTLTECLARARR